MGNRQISSTSREASVHQRQVMINKICDSLQEIIPDHLVETDSKLIKGLAKATFFFETDDGKREALMLLTEERSGQYKLEVKNPLASVIEINPVGDEKQGLSQIVVTASKRAGLKHLGFHFQTEICGRGTAAAPA